MPDTEHDLRDRLHAAADDHGRRFDDDPATLLPRARAARRAARLRSAGAALGVAVLVGGVGLAASGLTSSDRRTLPVPAPAASGGSPTTKATPPSLSHRAVVERCRPQLAKYGAYPMYSRHPERDRLHVAHAGRYRAGDLVALEGAGNSVLCRIPAAGHERDAVPFSAYDPAPDDDAAILQRCDQTRSGSGEQADLRRGTVLVVDAVRPVLTALVSAGGRRYTCSVQPVTWDAGIGDLGIANRSRYDVWLDGSTTGGSNKSIVGETAAYFYGAGTLDPAVARIDLATSTGVRRSVRVVEGRYAIMFKVPGGGGLPGLDIKVYDADGTLLHHQPPDA